MDGAEPTGDGGLDLRTDRAHTARIYDYMLGGKDNYQIDRDTADAVIETFPNTRVAARGQREFMQRSARFVAEAGIDQFLDIGTGIPTQPNLHQIVQAVRPESRVLYVDNDPIVLAHAGALMTSDPRGRVAYLNADARQPGAVLDSTQRREIIDLDRPVAVSIIGILHFLDHTAARELVRTLMHAVPSGSWLILTQATEELSEAMQRVAQAYRAAGIENWSRTRSEVGTMFLDGVEPVDPGIVVTHRWRPDPPGPAVASDADMSVWSVVARKP